MFLIILSIAFIILSVYYADRITTKYLNERSLLLKLGVILIMVLVALWIVDLVIYNHLTLLRNTTRDEILNMIKYLFIALVAAIIVKDGLNKKDN